jgi:hypothetical protein
MCNRARPTYARERELDRRNGGKERSLDPKRQDARRGVWRARLRLDTVSDPRSLWERDVTRSRPERQRGEKLRVQFSSRVIDSGAHAVAMFAIATIL